MISLAIRVNLTGMAPFGRNNQCFHWLFPISRRNWGNKPFFMAYLHLGQPGNIALGPANKTGFYIRLFYSINETGF